MENFCGKTIALIDVMFMIEILALSIIKLELLIARLKVSLVFIDQSFLNLINFIDSLRKGFGEVSMGVAFVAHLGLK